MTVTVTGTVSPTAPMKAWIDPGTVVVPEESKETQLCLLER
jgi:hypothetical protein